MLASCKLALFQLNFAAIKTSHSFIPSPWLIFCVLFAWSQLIMHWALVRFKLLDIGGYFIGAAGLITKRELQPLEGSGQLIQSIRFLRTEGPVCGNAQLLVREHWVSLFAMYVCVEVPYHLVLCNEIVCSQLWFKSSFSNHSTTLLKILDCLHNTWPINVIIYIIGYINYNKDFMLHALCLFVCMLLTKQLAQFIVIYQRWARLSSGDYYMSVVRRHKHKHV